MKDILLNISPEQAYSILERLWDRGGDIQKTIQMEAKNILISVNIDEVAQDIFFALDFIGITFLVYIKQLAGIPQLH